MFEKNSWDTVIIGAGQAGLSTGYFLKKKNKDFIILEKNSMTGDSWRNRWDSLMLFTPSQYDSLPGKPFPSLRGIYPGKNEMADYLSNYAREFGLPVRNGVSVTGLSSVNDHFEIETPEGKIIAKNVIVATGTNPIPKIPSFAGSIKKEVFQIHSSAYRNPDNLPQGDILVVGAGTSGVQIAIEVSKSRKTFLSGKTTFHIPDPVLRYAGRFYWWFISNVLTINTPLGRKVKPAILRGGAPLIRVSPKEIDKCWIERVPRVNGVKDGLPLLEDGYVFNCAAIIWATGYRPDFSWIRIDVMQGNGWPGTKRGISNHNGLNFVGMPFQYGLTSGLIGGVGRDAEYISRHLGS